MSERYSTLHEATGWKPEMSFAESVQYFDTDCSGTRGFEGLC